MGGGVGRSRHSVQRDDRRDDRAATRLATAGPAARHDTGARGDHRPDREAVGDPISNRSSVDIATAVGDPKAVDDACSKRGAFAYAGAELLTAVARGQRIEDGEPLDPDVRVDDR